jgi:hypothetical protein
MGHHSSATAIDWWCNLEVRVEANVNHPQTGPDKDHGAQKGERGSRRITLLLLIIAIVVLALLGAVAGRRLLAPNLVAVGPTPAATPEPTLAASPPEAEQPTPTATRVLAEATVSPAPQATTTRSAPGIAQISEPVISERVRNGSFEAGFKDQRVGLGWTPFDNGSAVFEFMDETWSPAVFDGQHAQRIQVREASQPDRYAGIYQTVSVVPGETYDLSLHGQIRSGYGDVKISEYGYRIELGIDYSGGQDWTAVDDWINLPWDEQRFDSDFLFFYDYIIPIVATGPRLTIFIRTWNKWPDPGRVEYTLDDISLMGPTPSEEIAFNEPLPATGGGPLSVNALVRTVFSVVVLCLLVAGAIWQVRRQVG